MEAFENPTVMKGFERFCITLFFATTQIRRPKSLRKKKDSLTFSASHKRRLCTSN